MQIQLSSIPPCFLHKRQITHICSCSACKIPNPMICADPQCLKVHAHPLQQIVPVAKLEQLLQKNTASMNLLIKKTKQYYKQIRESLSHQIQKTSDMMAKALQYKHTHPVINLFKLQKYNQVSPQKMTQLMSYLRGAKTERKSMENVKNQIYESLQKLQTQRKKLLQGTQFRKLMLMEMIDINSTFVLSMQNINTGILDNESEFKTIMKMLQGQHKKTTNSWELLFRASEHEFSADSYLMSIEGRGPFLMIFKTDYNKKFGCFLNCKVDKKEGWLTDGPGFSFIFSLDHDSVYPIKQQAKFRVKCFYVGDKGPQIGCGCDIYISDKCNSNKGSGSNLGGSFQLPSNLAYGSKQAKEHLTGQQNFAISQYQVYQLK